MDGLQRMRGLLTAVQCRAWEQLLRGLQTVCQALDAGFDPWTPPKGWGHGLLDTYMSPIPLAVREAVERAIPLFGFRAIEVYDPNPAHFVKPRKLDPLVLGHVDLAEQRLYFLVGQWDIPADMKFIEGHPRPEPTQQPLTEIARAIEPIWGSRTESPWDPGIRFRAVSDLAVTPLVAPQAKWVSTMYTSLGVAKVGATWQS